MRNIEIFKAISALTMAKLYESFPLPITLQSDQLAMKLDDELWDRSFVADEHLDGLLHYKREYSPAAIAAPTIRWLASSGFIQYERECDSKSFLGVVLSAKGLECIESEAGRGEKLMKCAVDIVTDATREVAKDELSSIFSDILKWSIASSPAILQVVSSQL